MCINIEKISLKIEVKTELKFKWKYIYRGKKTDLVGREVEVAEIKDRDVAPNKLKKEIAG